MKSAGIRHYFDQIILSDDIGLLKPNPNLFYFALSATQSELEHSLMIGDNFDTDITGARNAGMDQVFFNPGRRKKTTFKPTFEIEDLLEIMNLLP